MKITKEQIKELSKINSQTAFWCRKNFPKAFTLELEVGKWYFNTYEKECPTLFLVTKLNKKGFPLGPGFNFKKNWLNDNDLPWCREHDLCKVVEATEQEVFEALKNEAVKRGFVANRYYDAFNLGFENQTELYLGSEEEYRYRKIDEVFLLNDWQIFREGKWAEIIPTITKSEAEETLGKKII